MSSGGVPRLLQLLQRLMDEKLQSHINVSRAAIPEPLIGERDVDGGSFV